MSIATLIPAYKTRYISELFAGIQNQTHHPSIIIVSDDSPNGEFRKVLESYEIRPLLANLNIFVHEGPRNGAYANFKKILRLWGQSTELVHIMFDDDVMYPDFYQRHLNAHATAGISCSISRRWVAGDTGFPIKGQPIPENIAQHSNRLLAIDADVAFMTTIPRCSNWMGEFSNVVFRSEVIPVLFKPEFDGVSYAGLWDLGAFLAASLVAPIGYIQEYLGFFRSNDQGHSSQIFGPYMKSAVLAYAALALGGERIGKISETQKKECFSILRNAVKTHYSSENDMQPFIEVFSEMASDQNDAEDRFLDIWNDFLAKNNLR